jgi:hypothetical protein
MMSKARVVNVESQLTVANTVVATMTMMMMLILPCVGWLHLWSSIHMKY